MDRSLAKISWRKFPNPSVGQGVCYEAITSLPEAGMTSAIAAEQNRPRRLRGRSRRRRSRGRLRLVLQELLLIFGAALMFFLLTFFFGPGWAFLGLALPALLAVMGSAATGTRGRYAAPDLNKQFLLIGRLILLFAALLIFLPFTRSDSFQERMAVFNTPTPPGCDWSSYPVGDKHCHYEHTVRHVNTGQGQQFIVEWRRVND
jgi:hypothetical protein